MTKIQTKTNEILDNAEIIIATGEPVEMPLKHTFTDGMYIREIFMPAGTLLTSRIHKTNHPFVVTRGKCIVYDGDQVITITAPYTGITQPGTRRLLYIEEDTNWITYHATKLTDVNEIENEILEQRNNDKLDRDLYDKFHKINTQNNTYIKNKEELK
jgi:hypothetical protein